MLAILGGLRPWTAAAVLLMTAGAPQTAPDRQVATEIERVSRDAGKTIDGRELEAVKARLDRASLAVRAGRTTLALYELQAPFEMAAAWTYAKGQSGVTTMPAFDREWKRVGPPKIAEQAPGGRPAIINGLADSAEARAAATYRASRPYAEDAGIQSGLYYLGESRSVLQFAEFCRGLSLTPPPQVLQLRSIEPELAVLEREVVERYDRADADGRRPFIQINVALKLAHDLDARQRYAAALVQYLLARRSLSVITLGEPPEAQTLKQRVADARTALPAGDHSIAVFFLDMADAYVENGQGPGARGAAAILDAVMPAYFQVIKS